VDFKSIKKSPTDSNLYEYQVIISIPLLVLWWTSYHFLERV